MTRVKQLVLALVLDVVLFCNIERVSFGSRYNPLAQMQGFVYATGVVAVLATLVLPQLRQWRVSANVALWLGVYALGKLVFFASATTGAQNNLNAIVILTEIVFLMLSVIIAHALAVALYDLSKVMENITLSGIDRRLRRIEDAGAEVETELARSQRYNTPVSVIVVQPDEPLLNRSSNTAVGQLQKAMMSRFVVASMASVVTDVLRRTDLALEQGDKGRFVIVSPETDVASSRVVAEHIRSVLADRLHIRVRCGGAGFPQDASTFDELVRRAEKIALNGAPHTDSAYEVAGSVSRSSPAE